MASDEEYLIRIAAEDLLDRVGHFLEIADLFLPHVPGAKLEIDRIQIDPAQPLPQSSVIADFVQRILALDVFQRLCAQRLLDLFFRCVVRVDEIFILRNIEHHFGQFEIELETAASAAITIPVAVSAFASALVLIVDQNDFAPVARALDAAEKSTVIALYSNDLNAIGPGDDRTVSAAFSPLHAEIARRSAQTFRFVVPDDDLAAVALDTAITRFLDNDTSAFLAALASLTRNVLQLLAGKLDAFLTAFLLFLTRNDSIAKAIFGTPIAVAQVALRTACIALPILSGFVLSKARILYFTLALALTLSDALALVALALTLADTLPLALVALALSLSLALSLLPKPAAAVVLLGLVALALTLSDALALVALALSLSDALALTLALFPKPAAAVVLLGLVALALSLADALPLALIALALSLSDALSLALALFPKPAAAVVLLGLVALALTLSYALSLTLSLALALFPKPAAPVFVLALIALGLSLALQLAPVPTLPTTLALATALALQLAPAPALPTTLALAAALTLRPTLVLAAAFAALLLFRLTPLVLRHNDPRFIIECPGFGLYRARRGGNPHRRTYKENCVSRSYYRHFLAFRWIGHRQSCARL
jgi:hypothetical protein